VIRRHFLSFILAAGASAMILPGAGRRWVKQETLYVPHNFEILRFVDPDGIPYHMWTNTRTGNIELIADPVRLPVTHSPTLPLTT